MTKELDEAKRIIEELDKAAKEGKGAAHAPRTLSKAGSGAHHNHPTALTSRSPLPFSGAGAAGEAVGRRRRAQGGRRDRDRADCHVTPYLTPQIPHICRWAARPRPR